MIRVSTHLTARKHLASWRVGIPKTDFVYDTPPKHRQRTIAADPYPPETTSVLFDGFGREIQRTIGDSPQADTIDTHYDSNGRVFSVSNPYRSTNDRLSGNVWSY